MDKNKIITSQGNVQFINSKGKTISMHPMHCYAVYQDDTVSFLFIYMKEYSGQAFFASQFEDLEVDGVTYDSIDALKEAIAEAFAKAGAQARTEIVDELPETGYTNTIYLVKKEHGEGYDEYIYNEDEGWQLIGDTDIEFERYLQKVDFNAYSADTKEKIDYISGAVDDNASDIQFISGAVDTEIASREAADAVISGAVDTLSTNLSNEVQRAQNAEQTLQNNINTVNSRVDAEQIARANADNALSGAIDSVDDKIDTLSGEVETMGDEAIVDAEYVSSSTTIDFYNASGAVVAQVDATDFIKDGMIDDVRIETISGVTYLVIDFNTASGKEDIKIPLTDIFNPANYYDKTAVDNLLANKANSADVYNKSQVYTKAEVDEAIAEIDLSDYYNKTEVDGKLADKADLSALTEDERVWGEALNDLNSRINTVSGDVADKASQSAVDALNGVVTAHTANTTVHVTSAEKATWNAKSDFSGSYNDLTNKLSAGTNITIVDNVISATGGGGGGTVESAITSGSTNAVESKAIWSATTFNKNILLTFDGIRQSTNYPKGCGKLVVGNIGSNTNESISFNDDRGVILGGIDIENYGNISVNTSHFEGATYEIDGTTVIISYPSTDITSVRVGFRDYTYTAVVEGAWVNENTYMKYEVDVITNGLQNSKLDASAYTPTVVDSALNVASQNPVQNQALYSELRIDNGETETTLTFENSESTNYPNGCTKLIVEVVGSNNMSAIDFNNNDQYLGSIDVNNWGNISVTNSFGGASYEISGTTVIITYPTVTNVTKIRLNGSGGDYIYKAIVASATPLKDQVTANTTALGGLSLVKLTKAEYDALVTKDSNTLYIISD